MGVINLIMVNIKPNAKGKQTFVLWRSRMNSGHVIFFLTALEKKNLHCTALIWTYRNILKSILLRLSNTMNVI